jgi:hypothetical protein
VDHGAFLRLLTARAAVGRAVFVALTLSLSACGGEAGTLPGADLPPCESPLPASRDVKGVPGDFPKPESALYARSRPAGPSVIVEGFYDGDLGESFDAWREAFEAAGWTITKDERETVDAEVFFARGEINGQVNMFAECAGRTRLTITIRPS